MFARKLAPLVVAWLLLPGFVRAQHGEEHEVEVIGPPKVKPGPDEKKPDLARVVKQIVERTNTFRKEQGRPAVVVNDKLAEAARGFAAYMARTNRYGHTADGNRPADRARKQGYDYCIILENIAYEYNSAGFPTADLTRGFVEGWKHSPPHRRNMLDPDVTDTGVGVARSETTGYYFAVQMFGRPHSKAIEFRISNQSDDTVRYRIGGRDYSLAPRYIRTHTRCRPADVKFDFGKGRTKTVKPSTGDCYAVSGKNGNYEVKKQRGEGPG